jgi:hypothetical protein
MKQSNLAWREDPARGLIRVEDSPVLPSQFFRHRSRTAVPGERRLLLAIVEEAVDCYCKTCGRRERRSQNLHREAEAWIFSDDRSWFLSFQNICDVLDIDAGSLRNRLGRWKRSRLHGSPASPEGRVFPLRVIAE